LNPKPHQSFKISNLKGLGF